MLRPWKTPLVFRRESWRGSKENPVRESRSASAGITGSNPSFAPSIRHGRCHRRDSGPKLRPEDLEVAFSDVFDRPSARKGSRRERSCRATSGARAKRTGRDEAPSAGARSSRAPCGGWPTIRDIGCHPDQSYRYGRGSSSFERPHRAAPLRCRRRDVERPSDPRTSGRCRERRASQTAAWHARDQPRFRQRRRDGVLRFCKKSRVHSPG